MTDPIDVSANIAELGPPPERILVGIADIVARHYRAHPEDLRRVLGVDSSKGAES
ncbi:hypothetical protein IU438_18095 [Nocardia cyriacigeorgica]|uniref:hypothetical protein n=1 Tax=Nocardia cyriacigeorgica TaxID=135487 RepID=UPI0018940A4D|nr:hypothetical protein [Nocardia cyriacigeorgica]MBF6397703.1 hypothetical protein [Nocardia cyriacigeorgica]MBF6402639.1 hypothetical protein [Nocardia cyriacigeorgica]